MRDKRRGFLIFSVFLMFCYFNASSFAYFESIPLDFDSFSAGGGFIFRNPARSRKKGFDFVFQKPFQGIDESFSSEYFGAGYPFGGKFLGLNYRQFGFEGIYKETLTEFTAGKRTKNASFGFSLKLYKIALETDEYTSTDPYLSKTDASAYDIDLGFLKSIKNIEVSFVVSNVLGSGIGIKSDEKLNRAISVGFEKDYSFLKKRNNIFLELVKNSKKNYDSFNYYFGNFCQITPVLQAGLSVGRYYFTTSLNFSNNLLRNSDFVAGIAYRYPYGTDGDFSQFAFEVALIWK
jgi:hypothetical protein